MFPKILQERRRFLEQLRSSFKSCIHLTKCEAKALRRRTLWDMVYLRLNCDFTHLVSPALSDIGSRGILSQHATTLLNREGGESPKLLMWCVLNHLYVQFDFRPDRYCTFFSKIIRSQGQREGHMDYTPHYQFFRRVALQLFLYVDSLNLLQASNGWIFKHFFLLFTLWHSVPLRTRSRVKKI